MVQPVSQIDTTGDNPQLGNISDQEILNQLQKEAGVTNLGIGLALLTDALYGDELRKVFEKWKTNKTEALDLLFASKWAKLRPAARDRYMEKLQQSDVYLEDLRSWKESIRRQLKERGLPDISDTDLQNYFLKGTLDDVVISDAAKGFKFEQGKTGGSAADRYNALLAIAKKNGVSESKIASVLGMNSIDDVLKELDLGESLAVFEQKIRNYAKTAMPDWVRSRIDQGENLQDIVSPYISTVSDTLEVPWTSIDVTDPYIQGALAQNKTLYDLARDLRKDPKWQFTNKARQETSNAVLGVLRDFGFQG